MAITATLTITPTAPNHGDTVTAEYVVTGNDGTPAGAASNVQVEGDVTVGNQPVHVTTTLTVPGTPAIPALQETYVVPTAPGLTFSAVPGSAKRFTALVP